MISCDSFSGTISLEGRNGHLDSSGPFGNSNRFNIQHHMGTVFDSASGKRFILECVESTIMQPW